ncbi:MAG: phosphopantothenoylcysteine decarboxylase, partial [Limibaculum sp.]
INFTNVDALNFDANGAKSHAHFYNNIHNFGAGDSFTLALWFKQDDSSATTERLVANRSSGAQGSAIAAALHELGAEVVLVTGPATAPLPAGPQIVAVETAREMLAAVESALPADGAVFVAAVADWRVVSASASKIKKDGAANCPALEMTENPDILKTVAQLPPGKRPALVVGFAAETDDVIANATAKRARKGCDWIVANDVRPETGIMGGAENAVTLITGPDADADAEEWPRASKAEVARRLANRIADVLDTEGVA